MFKESKMTDIKQLKDEVKTQLDNKIVAEILIFIGYEITRDYKFQDNKSFSISFHEGERVLKKTVCSPKEANRFYPYD